MRFSSRGLGSFRSCCCVCLFAAAVFLTLPAGGWTAETVEARLSAARLAAPLQVDGTVEPQAWGATCALPFLSDLYRALPARAGTRIWVAYDDQALAVAWVCDEPGLSLDRLAKEADSPRILSESSVEMRLSAASSKGEKRRTWVFALNPRNIRYDERDGDPGWNAEWACGVKTAKDAWSAEMRIPFSCLDMAKTEDRKGLEAAFVRRVRGAAFETQGWPCQTFKDTAQPGAALLFAGGKGAESVPPDEEFWKGWRGRIADCQTSASTILKEIDPKVLRLDLTRRLVSEALERASAVDPVWGLKAGAAEPAVRGILTDLEERIRIWLADLVWPARAPRVPDRVLSLELPAPSGGGTAPSRLLLCGADQLAEPAPLVVNLHPSEEPLAAYAERFMKWRCYGGQPFLMLLPDGGGPRTRHRYDGEDEILEAIEAVEDLFPVDEDRVCLLGYSMGGVAAQRLAALAPGRFAAAVSIAGAGPADFVENLSQLPVFLFNGARDTQIPASYNQAWDKRRAEIEAPGSLTLFPDAGHDILDRALTDEAWEKLLSVSRPEQPPRVHFRAASLRYSQAYWVRIDRFDKFPPDAVVDFQALEGNRIEGKTQGAALISLELPAPLISPDQNVSVAMNGEICYEGPYRPTIQVELSPPVKGPLCKTAERGGPLDEAFRGPALYVWGTQGGAEWTEALRRAAESAARRPGFRAAHATAADTEVKPEQLGSANLFVFGGPGQNRLTAQLAKDLPVSFGTGGVRVGGETFGEPDRIAQFLYPSPFNAGRYVVFHWASSARAMRLTPWFLGPFRFQLLPDGVIDRIETGPGGVGVRRRVAEWWFGEDWRTVSLRKGEAVTGDAAGAEGPAILD